MNFSTFIYMFISKPLTPTPHPGWETLPNPGSAPVFTGMHCRVEHLVVDCKDQKIGTRLDQVSSPGKARLCVLRWQRYSFAVHHHHLLLKECQQDQRWSPRAPSQPEPAEYRCMARDCPREWRRRGTPHNRHWRNYCARSLGFRSISVSGLRISEDWAEQTPAPPQSPVKRATPERVEPMSTPSAQPSLAHS